MKFGEKCKDCRGLATIHAGRGNYLCPCQNKKQWNAVGERDRKEGIEEDRLMRRSW